MRTINTEKELVQLLQDRPEVTATYQVPKDLLGRIPRAEGVALRLMTDAEVQELSDYLGVPAERINGPLRVVEATCSKCSRRLTFLDFVKTAVDEGKHDLAQLRAVLMGKGGSWITIRGRDGGRPVNCAGCGVQVLLRIEDGPCPTEYSSPDYRYA